MWALTEVGDTEAIDVFVSEGDARRALADCVRDEPGWEDLLRVVEIVVMEEVASQN